MKYEVTLNGKTYLVEVEDGQAILQKEYDACAPAPAAAAAPAAAPVSTPPAAPAPAAVSAKGEQVCAPMPGNILKVCCTQGAAVKSGDLLIVLEAMKMENEILAPRDGTVAQIVVSAGSVVETGAPLVVLA